jgi:hypothetical protein
LPFNPDENDLMVLLARSNPLERGSQKHFKKAKTISNGCGVLQLLSKRIGLAPKFPKKGP